MLLGSAKVKFDLKPQTVIFDNLFPRQIQITAKENGVSKFSALHIDFFNNDDVQLRRKTFAQKDALIIIG